MNGQIKWKIAVVIVVGMAATASAVLYVVKNIASNHPNI